MGKFTEEDIKLAQKVQETYGVPASVVLGQYALESGYGTSKLAKNNNNFFGMRNGSKGWQKFDSKEESFMAYGKLLSSDLYTSKSNGATTVNEYVNSIAETYAPSSDGNNNYAGKVLKIISDNDLTQYDNGSLGFTKTSSKKNNIGLTWWGDIVKVTFAVLLLVGAIIFIGLAVTNSSSGKEVKKIINKVKEG